MAQSAAAPKPASSRSRFSKALPAVPHLRPSSSHDAPDRSTSHQLPPLPKQLPDIPPPPPPPPHLEGAALEPPPPQPPVKSPELHVPGAFPRDDKLAVPANQPKKMAITRRPVGGNSLSPLPEPSPTASISSLISAYSRPFESPTTTSTPSAATSATTSISQPSEESSGETSPTTGRPIWKKTESKLSAGLAAIRNLPGRPSSKDADETPPPVPSKSEIWRRRPQNDSREISGLKLDHSHGSTVSGASSIMSSSTASTQRPSTAIQDDPSSSQATLRKPPSVGGLPGRNVRPKTAQSNGSRAVSGPKPTISLVGQQSMQSLSDDKAPAVNRPPTPEYQKGEVRAPAVNTFASPASPASSPESPSMFSPQHKKELPPPPKDSPPATSTKPPPPGKNMLTEVPRRKPATLPVNGGLGTNQPQAPNQAQNSQPQNPSKTNLGLGLNKLQPSSQTNFAGPNRPPASSPANAGLGLSKPALSLSTTPFSSDPSLASRSESMPSDQSRGSSVSPTRRPRPSEQTPRQSREDPRIVQSEKGPLYRGRDGTLYPEMSNLREPDPRAFHFPTWKSKDAGASASADGVFSSHQLKESHYGCFQKHASMQRRTNRHYPLTCQTCSKANADDRWACSFCHLRICEPCFRVLDANARDLKRLVADIGRRTPLSLSSDSRPASAFGL